jgi:hypothetical protein
MTSRYARPCPDCLLRFSSRRDLATHRQEAHPHTRPPRRDRFARELRVLFQELSKLPAR